MTNENRLEKGAPGSKGGQYTHARKRVAEDVVLESVPGEELPDVGSFTADEIRHLASTTRDPIVLAELTASPQIPEDVLEQLSSHDQPETVRMAVAQTRYAGTADRAASDPNPLVRAMAAASWDLSPENREAIDQDGSVQRILAGIRA